jgi:hypothetical protein
MSKKFLFLLLASIFTCSSSFAQGTPAQKAKHADKNKDGIVDKKEIHMEKTWEKKQRSKVNSWWEAAADKNNDGRVDESEVSMWRDKEKKHIDYNKDGVVDAKEKRTFWKKIKPKVNTPVEAQYDKNNHGWLGPQEAKELLKDKHEVIKTHGKAVVDSSIEEAYDENKDGIIDSKEAEALKEDLE